MLRHAVTRPASLTTWFLVASPVSFLVVKVAPGDPASHMPGLSAQPDTGVGLRAELGRDGPKYQRISTG